MSYEEQRVWERNERERQDIEYDRDQAREQLEREQSSAWQRERDMKSRVDDVRSQLDSVYDELEKAKAELKLRDEWLKEKQLEAEFDDWASYRRTE